MDEALEVLRVEIADADGIYGDATLDDLERSERSFYSLRWILAHLIEEYSRHLGHTDLIREAIDGQTGE
ncbi:MAG: DinB family protein [Actinomycetia bacterium]|nr:DinB family protein [Actinomycetes bacterium]